MKNPKSYYVLGSIIFLVVFVNFLFYFLGAEKIVSWVGVDNTYLVVLAISTIGGLSTFTGSILFTTIATFAGGGANIFLLALFGGLGIFISDSIFYFLARLGRKSAPDNWEKSLRKVENWIKKVPDWIVLTIVYLYLSFTPFPTDLLMIALAVTGHTYRRIFWVLLAGSFTVALFTAYLGETFIS
jgi:membrane protein DedA with SNARE-associated domain